MTAYGIEPTVIRQISTLTKKHLLQKVILFGSRARENFHRTSDIDLAVHGGNIYRFRPDVEEETHTLLTFEFIISGIIEALEKSICERYADLLDTL